MKNNTNRSRYLAINRYQHLMYRQLSCLAGQDTLQLRGINTSYDHYYRRYYGQDTLELTGIDTEQKVKETTSLGRDIVQLNCVNTLAP